MGPAATKPNTSGCASKPWVSAASTIPASCAKGIPAGTPITSADPASKALVSVADGLNPKVADGS